MAATTFRLRIVTPERLMLDEDVDEVTAPGAAGEFGVLPDHIAFLTTLAPGRLIYKQGGQRHENGSKPAEFGDLREALRQSAGNGTESAVGERTPNVIPRQQSNTHATEGGADLVHGRQP